MDKLSNLWLKFLFFLCQLLGERDLLRDYEGEGNYTGECGWWLFGHWWISR